MAVKKTKEGVTFVFGHNTDSFVSATVQENCPKDVAERQESRLIYRLLLSSVYVYRLWHR